MQAMAAGGRFGGRNLRHEASKQARHESKRARKLQAKAERLQERIARRLECMLAAEQRLPRLERLSSALGLSPFEKNVVVAMIGQAIAPRSIGLMGGGGGGHSPSKTMQVEVLLRAFSSSLQQQIRHRSYFYKTAVLVREGILVLHGDELGADLTQTLAEIDRRMLDFVVGLDTEARRAHTHTTHTPPTHTHPAHHHPHTHPSTTTTIAPTHPPLHSPHHPHPAPRSAVLRA
jgi:hypothetical protein